MINLSTVIVTGAGAHKHVGYPLAHELKTQLIRFSDHINKDDIGYHSVPGESAPGTWEPAYLMSAEELKVIKSSADRLKTSSARTLDDFMQDCDEKTNKAFKKYIAADLIKREARSVQTTYNLDRDWYAAVLRKYTTKSAPDADRLSVDQALTIVTFNYDLYTEFRINQTLRSDLTFKDEDQAKAYVERINIIHPHGKLGSLDGIRRYGESEFLNNPNAYIEKLIPQFIGSPLNPEASSQDDEYARAFEAIEKADRVLFIGFGYHPTIMEKLPVHDANKPHKFFGSYFGAQQNPGEVYPNIDGYEIYMNSDDEVDYANFINRFLD